MSRRRASFRALAILAMTVRTLGALCVARVRSGSRGGPFEQAADRIGRRWARAIQRRIAMELVVEGELPEGPVAIVANHLSYLDIVALWCVAPGVFVARADVAQWPLIGVASRLIGTISIDRSRKRDLLRVIPELSSALASGRNVIFFPEATSSPGVEVLPFRSSLFEAAARHGVPVVAVSLQYETPGSAPSAAWQVCWWGDMPFAAHVFGLLKLPRLVARIRFADSIEPSQDRKELCRLARDRVLKKFMPTAPTSFSSRMPAASGRGAGRA
jgi:1-acyl-sn-glycerol-3-phosphate acyltransferase